MQPVIAETRLALRHDDGNLTGVRVYIRAPFDLNNGSWGCHCHIEGVEEKEVRICGEDSFQALCLAVRFLQMRLKNVIDRGGTVSFPGVGNASFPVEHLFGELHVPPQA